MPTNFADQFKAAADKAIADVKAAEMLRQEAARRQASVPRIALTPVGGVSGTTTHTRVGPGSYAGDVLTTTIQGIEVRWRWCPAGTYQMGNPPNETGRFSDEDSVSVTLTKGFWIMETECWQKIHISLMGNDKESEWPSGKGDRYPVYNVNHEEATRCGTKVTELLAVSGWKATLPTEAQWEYAVRAGSTYAYRFGDTPDKLGEYAWFADNSNAVTHPVGTKKPNAWGIHDGHGSLWEWTSDAWSDKLRGGNDPVNVQGPNRAFRVLDAAYLDFDKRSVNVQGPNRAGRGGSWWFSARNSRSAYRNRLSPGIRLDGLGFRLALVPSRES